MKGSDKMIFGRLKNLFGNQDVEHLPSPEEALAAMNKRDEGAFDTIEPGKIVTGTVDYVGDTFAKLSSGNVRATVFRPEMADHWVSQPSEVLSEDQTVEFVLKERSDRKPDEWIASIAAVSEARARQKLSAIERDREIHGTVDEIKEQGVVLKCDGFKAWIPFSEMAWDGIEHPSEVVRIGEEVKVKILRVELPDGWLKNRKARRAQAVVSRRACLPKPKSPIIKMPFSCLPFKVWVVPKKPRNCDPVVCHVLEELVRECGEDEILKSTGLPARTLDEILDLLEDEGLAQTRMPSPQGRKLVEAIFCARDLNTVPIRGLFASVAPRYLRRETDHPQREYPDGWARPPVNRRAETDFFNHATDRAHIEKLIEDIASDDQRDTWASLQQDERLRVFLRREGAPKIEYIPVLEHWVLAGLWSAFEAVGTKPYRPGNLKERCRDFLMIRLIVEVAGAEETKYLYFEPSTATYWVCRSGSHPKVSKLKDANFPVLPDIKGTTLPQGGKATVVKPDIRTQLWKTPAFSSKDGTVTAVKPDTWCIVRV